MTREELLAKVSQGTLTVIDKIDCLPPAAAQLVVQANFGDMNAAIAIAQSTLRDNIGPTWLWHVGHDNLAVLTRRDKTDDVIRVISMNQAHSLLTATMQAWGKTHLEPESVIR